MCLAVIDFQPQRDVPIRIVSNRDEFRDRPAEPLQYWSKGNFFAGRDLLAGGTWMGVNTKGDVALLTNIRPGYVGVTGEHSRGELVIDFLTGDKNAAQFHQHISNRIPGYAGFNLIVGNTRELLWFSSDHPQGQWLTPGIHGLSNDALNTPWPKLLLAKEQMQETGTKLDEGLLDHGILTSTEIAPPESLPQTGVPVAWESRLSAQTILGSDYGTRARTHLLLRQNGGYIAEQQVNDHGVVTDMARFEL